MRRQRLVHSRHPRFSVVFALALAALCLASGAKADALSAGKRAFARHDYVRAASLLSVEAERGSPVAQTYLGYMYQYGLGVPKTMSSPRVGCIRRPSRASRRDNSCSAFCSTKASACRRTGLRPKSGSILAAAPRGGRGNRNISARVRDAVAQKLTLNQLAEAQRRASAWAPIAGRNFGPLTARY